MLQEAFNVLSPVFMTRYQQLLTNELPSDPELERINRKYMVYAQGDRFLPRPILAYFGYHATSNDVDFSDVHDIADGLLLAQLLRDVLAIHDDVVDEDREKFGAPTLPLALSSEEGSGKLLTQHGKDLAIYYGDLLVGVMHRLIARLEPCAASRVLRLVGDTLAITSQGQLEELLIERRSIAEVDPNLILMISERKAAYYCYAFPFKLGVCLAGHYDDSVEDARMLLTKVGQASQVIDDITGAFPGVIDSDKDSIGELMHLRRTIPLILLAQQNLPDTLRRILENEPPLDEKDALQVREALWGSNVPHLALEVCNRLLAGVDSLIDQVCIGEASMAYFRDLIDFRLRDTVERLRKAINNRSSVKV
jgi:geranylgeranyl pyrophosphate synthase